VVRYDSNGHVAWSRTLKGFPDHVAVDADGNVVLTGPFNGTVDFGAGPLTSASYDDIFVAKLAREDGSTLWSKSIGGPPSKVVAGIAIDATGALVMTGRFSTSIDFGNGAIHGDGLDNVFVAKLTSTGGPIWSRTFASSGQAGGTSISVDAAG